jgi:type I restriction enzyme S subunit
VALGDLGTVMSGATPKKANSAYWDGDIPWVSPKDMKRPVIEDATDHISEKAIQESSLKLMPSGSILMVVRGMILVHSFPVAMAARAVTINQDMKALIVPPQISKYVLLFLQASKTAVVNLVDRSSHGTCKLVSDKLWALKVQIPPLAEQQRIFTKVDELTALCDQIKFKVGQAQELNERLTGALVEKAVS